MGTNSPEQLFFLHLGDLISDFTCQLNQADKQKNDMSAAQRSSGIPPSLCHNPFNSTFTVLGDVHMRLRHLEILMFHPLSPQAYFYKCIHTHTQANLQRMLRKMKHRMHARCERTR